MSRALSLKLDDKIYSDTERIRKKIHKPRNTYINEAVELYNRLNERKDMKRLLVKESAAVYKSSMEVLREFEDLEDSLP
jgi:predicted transcriptional regulator